MAHYASPQPANKTFEQPEGRPLPSVETEANGDSRSTYEKGSSLVRSLIYPALAALYSRSSTKYFFSFISFVPIARQA
jgi:hypothetical protein